jgi:hypothetical protein
MSWGQALASGPIASAHTRDLSSRLIFIGLHPGPRGYLGQRNDAHQVIAPTFLKGLDEPGTRATANTPLALRRGRSTSARSRCSRPASQPGLPVSGKLSCLGFPSGQSR